MPLRYYNVDPMVEGLGYGFASFMEARRRKQAENEARTQARKERQRKTLGMGIGAGAGLIAGPLLAPSLGLAGTAGSAELAGISAATEAGLMGPTFAGTAGALGAGGVLSGAGTLAAGLTGASLGAQAGGAFAEGDIAGGIAPIAAGIAGPLYRQQARRDEMADYATREGIQSAGELVRDRARGEIQLANELTTDKARQQSTLSNALSLEDARTSGNIRQARETANLDPKYAEYMRYREEQDAQQSASDAAGRAGGIDRGPFAAPPGMEFGPDAMGPPAPMPGGGAGGESNEEGPSKTRPGFDKQWGLTQWKQLTAIENERLKLANDPDVEHRAIQNQILDRAKAAIVPNYVKHQPTLPERIEQGRVKGTFNSIVEDAKGGIHNLTFNPEPEANPATVTARRSDGTEIEYPADGSPYEIAPNVWATTTVDSKGARKTLMHNVPPPKADDGKGKTFDFETALALDKAFTTKDLEGNEVHPDVSKMYERWLAIKSITTTTEQMEQFRQTADASIESLARTMQTASVPPEVAMDAVNRALAAHGGNPPQEIRDALKAILEQVSATSSAPGAPSAAGPNYSGTASESEIGRLEQEKLSRSVEYAAWKAAETKKREAADAERQAAFRLEELKRELGLQPPLPMSGYHGP